MLKSERITFLGIILNSILFIAKIIVGLMSNSTAVISDALNSFTDIFGSCFIFFSVRVANKKADETHPFGHDRAEPIAALTVAIITAILGFEIARTAFLNLFKYHTTEIGVAAIGVLIFNITVKYFMADYYIKKGKKRPAIMATGIDSRNDVLVSIIALIGVLGSMFAYHKLDDIAALIISMFILYSGYKIGVENIDYLMGKTPSKKFIEKVKQRALKKRSVKGVNDIRAHYVGNKIQIEIHIEVDKNKTTKTSHDIGKEVQNEIESMSIINKAFIHIDPV